ncbi:MAG: hypothetical protein KDC49_20095 [Saprospiraceae bacterium]|nr:hypothetical protein [Saprospiraceae bacterium]
MKNIIIIVLIGVFIGCKSKTIPCQEISGLWCNELNFCAYFKNDLCIIEKAEFDKFVCEDSILKLVTKDSLELKYTYIIHEDSLIINRAGYSKPSIFYKPLALTELNFYSLYYTQVSDFSDFSFYCDSTLQYKIDIKFHPSIKKGEYSGFISPQIYSYLNELINQMKPDIKNSLNPRISSDIQEWAAQIEFVKDSSYMIYHNYVDINEFHKNFSQSMNLIPYLVDKKETKLGDFFREIESFRTDEFNKNL